MTRSPPINVADLIKTPCRSNKLDGYITYSASPAKGVLFITENNPGFISGHVRVRARPNGSYPYHYLEMIDNLFGADGWTIEVCSHKMKFTKDLLTVDINPDYEPILVDDGQELRKLADNQFTRWRCDPPYNQNTSKKMYNCTVPSPIKLLQAGARVLKPRSLMFLLLGPKNYQAHPIGVKRIGMIILSIVPNNELRCLNIYIKL
jgi:hypothetical protein